MKVFKNPIDPENKDVPDFVKDIHFANDNSNIPVSMDYQFTPNNPYTVQGTGASLGESRPSFSEKEMPSFYDTATAEAKRLNFSYQAAEAGLNKSMQADQNDDVKPAGWNPKDDPSSYYNVKPEYYKYIFDATGPKDLSNRIQRVMQEQADSEALQNGSTFAKIVGGIGGIITDPTNLIPIVGWAKYAKLSTTFLSGAVKSAPGVLGTSLLQNAANQADKTNGNITDMLTNTFVESAFGIPIFGLLGVGAVTLDKLELNSLKSYAKSNIDGVDFKFDLSEKGEITGMKAYTTNEAQNAKQLDFAQELANSSFSKQGIFKVPYLGAGIYNFLSMPILGTPIPKLLNSASKIVSYVADRAYDHGIITKGVAEGKASPIKFQTEMDKEYASLRALSVQVDALHLERNGFNLKNRIMANTVGTGLELKNRGLKELGADLSKSDYISKESFYDEIENVLLTETPSEHAPVNEAAAMYRDKIDTTYAAYRESYNLPKDWMPPRTAVGYLMRVYDTQFLNKNEELWTGVVADWLRKSDEFITDKMQPINDLKSTIKDFEEQHKELIRELGTKTETPDVTERGVVPTTTLPAKPMKVYKHRVLEGEQQAQFQSTGLTAEPVPNPVTQLADMKRKLKSMQESMQDQLRANPDMNIHVDDYTALSATEAKELTGILTPLNSAAKKIEEQKALISDLKKKSSQKLSQAKLSESIESAKPKSEAFVESEDAIKKANEKLQELQDEYLNLDDELQLKAHNGEINPRYIKKIPDSNRYSFKDPNDRLKFRDTYESHSAREKHAKAYYDTIMNQTPEHTISQVMGRVTGNQSENHINQRSIMLPDTLLKENKFMTKDLGAKVNNYVTYLSRRTNLKKTYSDVTHDGGFEPLIGQLTTEYQKAREPLNLAKTEAKAKASDKNLTAKERKSEQKKVDSIEKELESKKRDFEMHKDQLNKIYNKLLGINNISKNAKEVRSGIMSFTAFSSLGMVPYSMITDLSAAGLQHGIWPFIRDGIYPLVTSLAGNLKTADSEGFRKAAASVNLALQDVLSGYADRNFSAGTQPYLNMGKIASGMESLAHFSSNVTLTTHIDNMLQRISGSIVQSEFMRILSAHAEGKMSVKDGEYLRKYGIDPNEWSSRMVAAFKANGGGKTALGGYQSKFWEWQDLEAANEFSTAVFRGIKNTNIQRGMLDSPFWADSTIGSLVHGFSGWMYASINRYVIPSMQQADAKAFVGVLFMLGAGALVSPMRRMARGEEPYPPNMTDKQKMFETFQDSGYMSFFTNVVADANLLIDSAFLRNLKNDKYRDRTRAGLLGPAFGKANSLVDIVGALATNEWNQADAKKAARMLPIANASWGYWMSKKYIESTSLPKTRSQARALKNLGE